MMWPWFGDIFTNRNIVDRWIIVLKNAHTPIIYIYIYIYVRHAIHGLQTSLQHRPSGRGPGDNMVIQRHMR